MVLEALFHQLKWSTSHGAREMQSRRNEENRGSLKSPVINWKLIWKLRQHQAPTHWSSTKHFMKRRILIKMDRLPILISSFLFYLWIRYFSLSPWKIASHHLAQFVECCLVVWLRSSKYTLIFFVFSTIEKENLSKFWNIKIIFIKIDWEKNLSVKKPPVYDLQNHLLWDLCDIFRFIFKTVHTKTHFFFCGTGYKLLRW